MNPLPLLLIVAALAAPALAQDKPAADAPRDLIKEAQQAYQQGKADQALALLDTFIKDNPNSPRGYFVRAAIRDEANQFDKSLPDYDKAIALDPKLAAAYQRRGVAHFMLGHAKESVADFDKYLESHPDERPHHWQRGISLYYAGRFEDGTKQFDIHRSVNPNDVENAAWHFLCLSRWKSVKDAQAVLIPIQGDARVPMMKVHEMFAGKATPDDVLAEAKKNDPKPAQLNRHLFYAHLYIGLFHEATGNHDKAKEHLKAAIQHEVPDYMHGVAKVHVQLLQAAKP
jgi:lipoprotein NlpI